MKKVIIIIIISFLLTGCNYLELNKLAVVSGLGIDYKDGLFEITAQVMDVKKTDGGSMEEASIIYQESGETIGKAIRNMSKRYPKTVYLGHLELIIIGKEVSNGKINYIFDYIARSPEVRSTGYVLINKDKTARETLNPSNENDNGFATEQIISTLKNNEERTGTTHLITFDNLLIDYLKKGLDPTVPLIKIDNKDNLDSKTIVSGLTTIKNGKTLKNFTDEEAIAYNTINSNYSDIVITPIYKNKPIGIVIFNPKSKTKANIKNNDLNVNIDISIEAKLNEFYENEMLTDGKANELKKLIEKELTSYVNSLLAYSKNNNADVLGIKNMIYKNYYKKYPKYKNINVYEKAKFNINIKTKIYRSGNIIKGAMKNEG